LDWHRYIEIDPRYFRPSEVDLLQGDASKAKKILNWKPRVTFQGLVKMMVDADMRIAEDLKIIKDHQKVKK
jgi:GDPmannose 4,6-dehydratase